MANLNEAIIRKDLEKSINESDVSVDVKKAQDFVQQVKLLAAKMKLNVFVVTDGASGTLNNGSEAVRIAREAHAKWEMEHDINPDEDWGIFDNACKYLEKLGFEVDHKERPNYLEFGANNRDIGGKKYTVGATLEFEHEKKTVLYYICFSIPDGEGMWTHRKEFRGEFSYDDFEKSIDEIVSPTLDDED